MSEESSPESDESPLPEVPEERSLVLESSLEESEPEEEPEENAALPPLLLNALRSFREERREKEPAAPEERADTPVVPASTAVKKPTAPLIAPLVVDTRVKARDVFGKAD